MPLIINLFLLIAVLIHCIPVTHPYITNRYIFRSKSSFIISNHLNDNFKGKTEFARNGKLVSSALFATRNNKPKQRNSSPKSTHKSKEKTPTPTSTLPSMPENASKKANQKQMVERLVPKDARKALSTFKIGQKIRGRIISFTPFGMFVDIGSTKDGLVHIKDASNTYFLSTFEDRFSPGEDLDVWIKFLDPEQNILALQLYDPQQSINTASKLSLQWSDLSFRKEVSGKVLKSSDYGVYVDIGAPVLAFLHRRKMMSNRRQRKLKPWEVAPIGSTVSGYIYKIDMDQKKIEICTYSPDRWEKLFPTPIEKEEYEDDDDEDFSGDDERMIDDDEELGGTAAAQNFRAMERILKMTDDEYDEEEGEVLSSSEIEKLTGRKMLIDDTQSEISDDGNDPEIVSKSSDEDDYDDGNDMSIDELFTELSQGKGYISMTDLREWTFVKELMKIGDLSAETLREVFRASGAVRGKLSEDNFERFVTLFENELNGDEEEEGGEEYETETDDSDEDNEDFDDDEDMDMEIGGYEAEEEDDDIDRILQDSTKQTSKASSSSNKERVSKPEIAPAKAVKAEEILIDDFESSDQNDDETDDHSDEDLDEISTDNLFAILAEGKDHVTSADIEAWSYTQELLETKALDKKDLKDMLSQAGGKRGKLDKPAFERFVDILIDNFGEEEGEGEGEDDDSYGDEDESSDDHDNGDDEEQEEEEQGEEGDDDDEKANIDEEDEEIIIEKLFDDLSNGADTVSSSSIEKWSFVSELLENKELSKKELRAIISEAGGVNNSLDRKSFEKFMDIFADMFADKESAEQTYASKAQDADEEEGEEEGEYDEEYDEEGEDDLEEMSFDEIFEGISKGKELVSTSDIEEWEYVRELLEDKILSKKELKELIASAGGKKGKLDKAAFGTFLDSLISEYGDDEDYEDNDDEGEDEGEEGDYDEEEEEEDDPPVKKSMSDAVNKKAIEEDDLPSEIAMSSKSFQASDKAPTNNDLLDNVFKRLAGKNTVIDKDKLLQWDLCSMLIKEGLTTKDDVLDMAEDIMGKAKGLDRKAFAALVDKLKRLGPKPKSSEGRLESKLPIVGSNSESSKAKEDISGEDDDENDGELLTNVFANLAGGKNYLKAKDLLNWDFVLDLLTEGVLTEDSLEEKVKGLQAPKSKGLDLSGFDKLVNELVVMYKDSGIWEEYDDSAESTDPPAAVAKAAPQKVQSASVLLDDSTDLTSGDEEVEIELDPEELFEELANGQDFVSAETIRSWDVVKSMIAAKELGSMQLDSLLSAFETENPDQFTLGEFEGLLDEILILAGYDMDRDSE